MEAQSPCTAALPLRCNDVRTGSIRRRGCRVTPSIHSARPTQRDTKGHEVTPPLPIMQGEGREGEGDKQQDTFFLGRENAVSLFLLAYRPSGRADDRACAPGVRGYSKDFIGLKGTWPPGPRGTGPHLKPSCRHTTCAFSSVQPSSQTVPHCPL